MKAYLKNYRQSPRKVRLVADLIKGKPVRRAMLILDTTPKRATTQMKKLLSSAVANAKNSGQTADTLRVKEVRVDKGLTMHRFLPRAHGRASGIDKHSSNVILELSTIAKPVKKEAAAEAPKAKKPAAKKTIKKTTKK